MRLALLGVALLATCVIVQSLGMLVLIRWLSRVRRILESRSTYLRVARLLRLFVGIVLLHLVQVGLWAVVFWRAGAAERGHGALHSPSPPTPRSDSATSSSGLGGGCSQGSKASPTGRLVDGVRVRGRESDVRAREAGPQRIVNRGPAILLKRNPRCETRFSGCPPIRR